MLEAILHYALAPLRFAALPLAALNAATGGGEGTPRGALLLLLLLGFVVLHLPKLAGYAEALLRPGRTRRAALLRGMAGELALSLLLETPEALERTLSLLRLARGRFGGWAPQPRAAREVTWAAASRRFGWHTAAGLAMAGGFGAAGGFALLAALPALAGLSLAVLTARPGARATAAAAVSRSEGLRPSAG
jgi:membrane glycosyltransferase